MLRYPFVSPEDKAEARAALQTFLGLQPRAAADVTNDSVTGGPEPHVARDSVTGRPDPHVTRDSVTGRPDPHVARDSVTGRPDPHVTRDSVTGGPDLHVTRYSVTGKPDRRVTRDSVTGRPDPHVPAAGACNVTCRGKNYHCRVQSNAQRSKTGKTSRELSSFLAKVELQLRDSQQRNERRCQLALETLQEEAARETLHAELDVLRVLRNEQCAEEETRREAQQEVSSPRVDR